jgi:cytochrome c-type biogenesis protein CcmH/NrfG
MNKILRYIIISCIFLVLLVPLIKMTSTMFFPFITARNFYFRFLVEVMFGAWLILALRDVEYRPRWNWLLASLVAFLVVLGFADAFGMNPYKSFWSNFERMEGLVTILHLAAYAVVMACVLRTEKWWNYLIASSIGVSLIVTATGFLQLAGLVKINQSGTRLDANFGNSDYLAVYLLFHIFLTAFYALHYTKNKIVRWACAVIILLEMIILYYTATRGVGLGLLAGIGLASLLVAILERTNKKLRMGAISVLIILALGTGVFFLIRKTSFVNSSDVLSRYSSISLGDVTTQSRFLIWHMAWEGFKERPILGWGQENFNYVFNKYYNPQMYAEEQWFDRTHDIVFDWLIAGGALGLITYLSIFAFIIYYLWKQDDLVLSKLEKSLLTGLLAGYFFQNLFVFDNLTSYMLYFLIFAYVYGKSQGAPLWASKTISADTVDRIYAPIIVVLTCVAIYFAVIIPYLQNTTLLQAISPQQAGVPENLALFKKVFDYNSLGNAEAREQLVQIGIQIAQANVDPTVQQQFDQLVRQQYQLQLAQTPQDARYFLFYGSYLDNTGHPSEALPFLQKAAALSPGKQSILFELGSAYMNMKDYDDGLATMKQAYEADTADNDALINYAVAAVYDGKVDLAKQLTDNLMVTNDDDRLVTIYVATKEYAKLVEVWQAKVKNDPTNAQDLVSLAAAQLQVGDRTDAIADIQKAIELDPDFKTQGETYIRQIQGGGNPEQ